MLDIPKEAQRGLQQLSKDLYTLLHGTPQTQPQTTDEGHPSHISSGGAKGPLVVNNIYNNGSTTPETRRKNSFVGLILKIGLLLGCIAFVVILLRDPTTLITWWHNIITFAHSF